MNAFHNWKSLSSLTIPSSVDSIELFAFSGCDALSFIDYDGYKNPAEGCLLFGYVFPGFVAEGYENKTPIIRVTKKYKDEYGKFGEVTVLFDDEDDDNNDYKGNVEVNRDLPIAQAEQQKDENQKPKPAIRRSKHSYGPGSLFAQMEAEPQQNNNSSNNKEGKKKSTLKAKTKAKQKSIKEKSINYDELNETQQNENLDLNNVDP